MTTAVADERRLLDLGRGPERELERLYRRHASDVRRYVHSVLRNRSDAEDAIQQTFLKALRALQSGTRPERPRQWLLAIAHNECLMHFRAEARRPAQVALEEALDRAAEDDGPRAAEIGEALAQLRPAQRAALVMRELEGRAYAEIAAALGVSKAAVETLLFRARRALREQLDGAGGCRDATELLAAETLTDDERRFLRAHLRSCAECATLDRRRRGRLAALRRIASVLPMPGWLSSLLGGGGKAAVAVAVAAVAAGGTVEAVKGDATPRPPAPAPVLVHHDPVPRPAHRRAAARRVAAPVSVVSRAPVDPAAAPAQVPVAVQPTPRPATTEAASPVAPQAEPSPPPSAKVVPAGPVEPAATTTTAIATTTTTTTTAVTDTVAALPLPEPSPPTVPTVTVATVTVTVPTVTVSSLTNP